MVHISIDYLGILLKSNGRAQSGIEYLVIYGIAILIIAVAIAIIALSTSTPSLVVPSSCNFVDGLVCHDIIVGTNSITHNTTIALALSNPLSYPIYNATVFANIAGHNSIAASCLPKYVQPSGTLVCVFSADYNSIVNQFVSGTIYANLSYCGASLNNSEGKCNSATQEYVAYFTSHAQPELAPPSISLAVIPASPYAYTNGVPDKITAELKIFGYPIGNEEIAFSENATAYRLSPLLSLTDSVGNAITYVSGTTVGTDKITATFSNTIANTTIQFINPGSPPQGSTTSTMSTTSTTTSSTTSTTTSSTTSTVPQTYSLTTGSSPANGGSVLPVSNNFVAGTKIPIIADPSSGYIFSGWSCTGAGCYSGTSNTANFIITSNTVEIANFKSNNNQYMPVPELVCNLTDTYTYFISEQSTGPGLTGISEKHNNVAYVISPVNNTDSPFLGVYTTASNVTFMGLTQKNGSIYAVNSGGYSYSPYGSNYASNFSIIIFNSTTLNVQGVITTNIPSIGYSSSASILQFDNNGDLYIANLSNSGTIIYVINSTYLTSAKSGRNVFDNSVNVLNLPRTTSMVSDGRYMYYPNVNYSNSNYYSVYVFDTTNDVIVKKITIPINNYGQQVGFALYPSGEYLYDLAYANSNLTEFIINDSNWAISNVINLGSNFDTSYQNTGITFAYNGSYAYLPYTTNTIEILKISDNGAYATVAGNYVLPYGNYIDPSSPITISPNNKELYFLADTNYVYGATPASYSLSTNLFNYTNPPGGYTSFILPQTYTLSCSAPVDNYNIYVLNLADSAGTIGNPQGQTMTGNVFSVYQTYDNYLIRNITNTTLDMPIYTQLLTVNMTSDNQKLLIGGQLPNTYTPFLENYNVTTGSTRFLDWAEIFSQLINNVPYSDYSIGNPPLQIISNSSSIFVTTSQISPASGSCDPYCDQGAYGDLVETIGANYQSFYSPVYTYNAAVMASSGYLSAIENTINTISWQQAPSPSGTSVFSGGSVYYPIVTAFDTEAAMFNFWTPSALFGNANCSEGADWGPLAIPTSTNMQGEVIKNGRLYLLSNQQYTYGQSSYMSSAYTPNNYGSQWIKQYEINNYPNLNYQYGSPINLGVVMSYTDPQISPIYGGPEDTGNVGPMAGGTKYCGSETYIPMPYGYDILGSGGGKYWSSRYLTNTSTITGPTISPVNNPDIFFLLTQGQNTSLGYYNTTTGYFGKFVGINNFTNIDGGATVSPNGTYMFISYPTSYGEWGNGICSLAIVNLDNKNVNYFNDTSMPCGHVTITPDGKYLYVGAYELNVHNLMIDPEFAVINTDALPTDLIPTLDGPNYVHENYVPGQASMDTEEQNVV